MSDEQPEGIDPLSLFSAEIRLPVQGLAHVGHLQKEIEFCGHTFTIKTLRPSERAAAAIAAKPWSETITEPEVWANAQVGMALVAVDGNTDFCPAAGPDINSFAGARLRYLTHHESGWYAPTLAYLYESLIGLESLALEAVDQLRNLSRGTPRVPSPTGPDSLTAPDTSDAPTYGDSPS